MTYQFADINGTKIHYDIQGEGTAVVLIHAGIVNLHMWQPQMDVFTQNHRVLRYDLRGWGETVRPDTAHFPSVEKPAEFNQLVLSFLAEQEEVYGS